MLKKLYYRLNWWFWQALVWKARQFKTFAARMRDRHNRNYLPEEICPKGPTDV